MDFKNINMNQQIIENAVSQILSAVGEDPKRHGLKNTPSRVASAFAELTSGYGVAPFDVVRKGIFKANSSGMVVQKDIEFASLCEHHLLPFTGYVHVAYMPDEYILGLSKLGRIVDIFSKRLQIQEELNCQIANALLETVKPHGVAVVIEAKHFCMSMRGVKKNQTTTTTSKFLGIFSTDAEIRKDFLHFIKK